MMTIDWSFLTRKKKYDSVNVQQTKLHRVLNLSDIVALGVSCTLGNGIYVLAGDVIGNYAGPSIIFSFIFAGLVTLIAGICYAEFGARVPRSGSGYVYIYVTIGEFVAFVLGWDLILEYVIGVSSGASAISGYVNSLANGKIFTAFRAAMPMNVDNFASFPDFLSFGFVVVITLLMVAGVKESTFLNKIFTVLNVVVIAFIFIAGLTKANKANWYLAPNANTSWIDINGNNQTCQSSGRCGTGGFLPFGFYGIVKGSAKCFYAFIGFDAIATTGEEVMNPKRNIPLSIVLTLATVATCYCSVSLVLTLMIPYYIVDVAIPIPQAFDYVQMHWATPVVTVGAMASLITCLYASMFPMPRVVYSLASDGLIFKFLGYVLPRFKTPVAAAISSGLFAGILCLVFDLNQLIDMLSIGTLLAYSVVSICVVVLRYRPPESDAKIKKLENNVNNTDDPTSYSSGDEVVESDDIGLLKRLFKPTSPVPTKFTSLLVNILCALGVVHVFLIALFMTLLNDTHYWYIYVALIIVFVTGFLMISFIISRQPQDRSFDSFKVPFVYFLPFMSVLFNIYLIMALSVFTWLRFAVWFVVGLFVYFLYGRTHSTLAKKPSSQASQVSF